jgi:hypothetical protein
MSKYFCLIEEKILSAAQVKKSRPWVWSWEPLPWSDKTLEVAKVKNLHLIAPPKYNPLTQSLMEVAEKIGDEYHQKWLVTFRYEDVHQERAAVIAAIKSKAADIRGRGIYHDGVWYGTQPHHLVLMQTGVSLGATVVTGDNVVERTAEQIKDAYEIASAYIQACYSHEASLIQSVKNGDIPNIDEGWPSNE